ncbi:SLC13 family permease [Apilactobacillus micheneri]|uniref:Carboxylate transporter n=1 Tax=Apilactobacillus micheneri TaxID=1899430 RepID=A0A9Q8IMX4_9LACO|nr:SLC13 family permease [Apilactobacillus micheneri]TPR39311.1 carboxylate transporter [Apilactobacillus micheneri]TPR41513.1 carboxylate transporter [Apilactobacillus micheneri]TPR43416.1 carboxylate transporter [Apilactobacillus micheneri]TPR44533.1 carboxylate transporter [Apilactobacillus micheneri]TPR49340.1 carboxylate transporter [Apilactobacillus micheneri]
MNKIKNNIFDDPILKIVIVILILMFFIGTPRMNDINFTTIISLFTMMMLVSIIKYLNILKFFSNYIINISHSTRQIVSLMTIFSFLGSMLVTNDIAIITLVPLYIEIAYTQKLSIPYPVTLITIASNLGSSVTPFGNPQNVFLLSYYHLSINQFFNPAFIILLLGMFILGCLVLFVKNKKINANDLSKINLDYKKCLPVIILIIFIFLGIFEVINLWIPFAITLIYGTYINRSTITDVDYSLLLSFVGFFLIVGILSRNQLVIGSLNHLLNTSHQVFFSGALISQIISNVPGAVLIAKFTNDFYPLYLGVNIGGLGSLVASLANLLAFKQVQAYANKSSWQFLKIFTLNNIMLLILSIILISFII